MGSWAELDARYEPGKLTPATAFIVALGHAVGATSVYADRERCTPAAFLPPQGLGQVLYAGLLERAEPYLQDVPLDQFLTEAQLLLTNRQKLCILLHMLDIGFASGAEAPEGLPLFQQFCTAFAVDAAQIEPYVQGLRIKHNLNIFLQ